jgi:GH24 family phage-related lysozyme (muramidase)
MIDLVKVGEDLKKDEGFRGCSYKCSAGKITIGYGHNIEDNPIPEHMSVNHCRGFSFCLT